jgi:hypothetical protein
MEASFLVEFPDDLVLGAYAYLQPADLLAVSSSCPRLAALPLGLLWRAAYARLTAAWPMYALTPEHETALDAAEATAQIDWKRRYGWMCREAQRTVLTEAELGSMRWLFNFTARAGGRGRATLKEARFVDSNLMLPGFPPLPYTLVPISGAQVPRDDAEADGRGLPAFVPRLLERAMGVPVAGGAWSGVASGTPPQPPPQPLSTPPPPPAQAVCISNFPPHTVARVPSTREWLVSNANVTLVSCHATDGGFGSYTDRNFLDAPPDDDDDDDPV